MMRNNSSSIISSLQMDYGGVSDEEESDSKNTSRSNLEEEQVTVKTEVKVELDEASTDTKVTPVSDTEKTLSDINKEFKKEVEESVLDDVTRSTNEETQDIKPEREISPAELISDDEDGDTSRDSSQPSRHHHHHYHHHHYSQKVAVAEAVNTDSPSSQGSLKAGRKATRLVSYGPDEDVDEDESSSEEEEVQEPSVENSPELNSADASILSRSVQNMVSDDIKIPPEPPGKCSAELQKKIEELYARRLHGGLDLNRVIQSKKNFRNPRAVKRTLPLVEAMSDSDSDHSDASSVHSWVSLSDIQESDENDVEMTDVSVDDDEEENIDDFVSPNLINWVRTKPDRPAPLNGFTVRASKSKNPLQPGSNALDYFKKYFPDAYLKTLAEYTHSNAVSKLPPTLKYLGHQWVKPTVPELKQFIGILLLTNSVLYPARERYLWDQRKASWPFHTPGLWDLDLTFHRFAAIKHFICFSSDEEMADSTMKTRHITGLVAHLSQAFVNEFWLGQHIAIDEVMIPFKGRHSMKQYLNSKPVKWGFRIDFLSDWDTSYCYRFLFYGGKEDIPRNMLPLDKQGKTVCQLLQGLENKGHLLTIDRGYTSPTLLFYLRQNGIGACGTVDTNCKGFPKELVTKRKQTRGEWDYRSCEGLLAVRWADSDTNYFMSNFHDPTPATVECRDNSGRKIEVAATTLVNDYNTYMNAVDKTNQRTVFSKSRKQYSWPMRFFMKALAWSVNNAFVLYKEDRQVTSASYRLLDFVRELIVLLLGERTVSPRTAAILRAPKRLDPSVQHTPIVSATKNRKCVVCAERYRCFRDMKAANPNTPDYPSIRSSSKTAFACAGCGAALCIKKTKQDDGSTLQSSCWLSYHTKKEYWRPLPWETSQSVSTPSPATSGRPTPVAGPSTDA